MSVEFEYQTFERQQLLAAGITVDQLATIQNYKTPETRLVALIRLLHRIDLLNAGLTGEKCDELAALTLPEGVSYSLATHIEASEREAIRELKRPSVDEPWRRKQNEIIEEE